MSIELTMLVWSAALAVTQMLIAFIATMLEFGQPDLPGGRGKRPPTDSFSGRAQRASQNMLQSLVPFAALILAAEVANRVNPSTGLGAEVFLGARVAYAIVALIDVTLLQTGVWCVSILATLLILAQLVW
jgi:uncharacterized MAPEG superfamily protein